MRQTVLRPLGLFLQLFFVLNGIQAQTGAGLAGQYYLQGVAETASGFRLNSDSSFEFFFHYGAIDRYGKGVWKVEEGALVLSSLARPADDFKLLVSKKTNAKTVTIKVTDKNTLLPRYVFGTVKREGQDYNWQTEEDGTARVPARSADTIIVLFEFCPEKMGILPVKEQGQNYFEIGFGSSIMEVYFDRLHLAIGDRQLSGPHPLLAEGAYIFKKGS